MLFKVKNSNFIPKILKPSYVDLDVLDLSCSIIDCFADSNDVYKSVFDFYFNNFWLSCFELKSHTSSVVDVYDSVLLCYYDFKYGIRCYTCDFSCEECLVLDRCFSYKNKKEMNAFYNLAKRLSLFFNKDFDFLHNALRERLGEI